MSDDSDWSADEEEGPAIVIDNGSSAIRAGFSGDDEPTYEFINEISGNNVLSLKYPIEHGLITHWNEIEQIWKYIFYDQLKTQPEEHAVLLTEIPCTPKQNREKLTTIMFETFNTPSMYLAVDAVLALHGSGGGTTGTVVDCGYDHIRSVVIGQGYAQPESVLSCNYGGKQCTEYLKQLIMNQSKISEMKSDDVRKMKEKFGYVALDYDKEMNKKYCDPQHIISGYLRNIDTNSYIQRTPIDIEHVCLRYSEHFIDEFDFINPMKLYQLPDGRMIKLGNETVQCTEMLFNPKVIKETEVGVHECVYDSISKGGGRPGEYGRHWVWDNIVISGGSSLFPGFASRLEREIKTLIATGPIEAVYTKAKVKQTSMGGKATWIGGSILSSLCTFGEMWITKDEYEESGAGIVGRKCF